MLKELSILIITQSVEFLLLWDVVCGVHIAEILFLLVLLLGFFKQPSIFSRSMVNRLSLIL